MLISTDKMHANSRYSQHFQAAKNSLRREQYGDALAHMVFLANVEPSVRHIFEEDFNIALRHWAEILERHGELEKLMVCLQEALKLYPRSEDILINTGASLLRLKFSDEAASCFRRALHINPMSLKAKQNLETIANLLVERWHFRMLNDKQRNAAYKQAIHRAISHGYDTVLDIGSGTGILSMFAIQGGAKEVYACEMSKTMYELGRDVLKANKMESVHTIHKKSTEMKVGKDIPERVSLVVTETLDCGLLGEGILTTIKHAWRHLLLASEGPASEQSNVRPVAKVIPGGAVLFAMVIMCDDIKNQTRSKSEIHGMKMFPECSFGGEVMEQNTEVTPSSMNAFDQLEPYSTECLNYLRAGFTPLSDPFKVAELNFNDPSSLCKDQDLHLEVKATSGGRIDAIAAWFDLLLDEETALSTGPEDSSLCWEQAIFPFLINRDKYLPDKNKVSKGDLLSVQGKLSQECLRLNFGGVLTKFSDLTSCSKNVKMQKQKGVLSKDNVCESYGNADLLEETNVVPTKDFDSFVEISRPSDDGVAIIPSSYMRRLNDEVFNELFDNVIGNAIKSLKCEFYEIDCLHNGLKLQQASGLVAISECNVLDITCGPSLLSLFASRAQADCVLLCSPHSTTWTNHILTGNNLPSVIEYGPMRLEEIARDGKDRKWNVLISDIAEPAGILRQQVIEDIVFARGCLLMPNKFQIIPMGFTLLCMCIESPFLLANCCITNCDNTLGLDIGRFVNEFQVTTQVDLDLTTLPFIALTDNMELFSMNFMEDFSDDHGILSMLETRFELKVKATKSGKIQAIPYWFTMHMDSVHSLSTYSGAYTESHWRQAAVVLKDEMLVEAGEELLLSGSCENSSIFIDVRRVENK